MEVKEKYTNPIERAKKITLREGQGLRMLFDNFNDPNWKHGDPQVGTMTFTDKPEPQAPIIPPARDLAAEVDQIKKAAGIGVIGEKGIATRIDDIEARLAKLYLGV